MIDRIYLNDAWSFCKLEDYGKRGKKQKVRLPHSNALMPFNYFDEKVYQFVSIYETEVLIPEELSGKVLMLTFEGAAHKAEVYVNDTLVCTHNCGYTAFAIEIENQVIFGEKNKIRVVLDSRENLNIPPFGHVIDYMTYGGIYREVYIDVEEKSYIKDIFVKTKDNTNINKVIEVETEVVGNADSITFNIYESKNAESKKIDSNRLCYVEPNASLEKNDNILSETFNLLVKSGKNTFEVSSAELKNWSVSEPNVYLIEAVLEENGAVVDRQVETFGVRTAEFKRDGFYLNGEKIKIRGLNRHQAYPYVGYAMPKSAQEHDAYVLKNELFVNAVRTSHYPQSKYFLNACDRLGLLVFTEAPGWQHIGNDEWKAQHLQNVKDMVLQNRNHPSIVLWGVRVNESQDDNKLYKEANKIAHELDNSRQTSGVRFLQMSNLLEDVYAFNDFSHTGNNSGLTCKKMVTPKLWKPYIVSEFNGHMFPTKSYDCEEHRLNHALRYSNVLNSMYKDDNGISGCFGWCMFDYNTHKDFGSGDKICYHGVLDMFRNPKLAASVYASQGDEENVCEVSSSMDIGEHPGGCLGTVYVFTNADYISLYKNDEFVANFYPDKEDYPNLPHPPIKVDDLIGCLLVEKEGISEKSSDNIKKAVKGYMDAGFAGVLTPKNIAGLGSAMVKEKLSISDGMDIFYKYVGNWGGDVTIYRFDAIKNGKVVKSVMKAPTNDLVIDIKVSNTELCEDTTYDTACVNITALSEHGNLLNYCNDPIMFSTDGAIELIGPKCVPLRGGFAGTYVKTNGKKGKGRLIVEHERFGMQIIEFNVLGKGQTKK